MILQAQFGIFETLTQYGVLGFAVLGLGYLCWNFLQKLMKSEEEYRTKYEELEEEVREDLAKTLKETKTSIKENTESSKSLKETIMLFISNKKK
jgi:hypothetical protein